MNFEQQLYRMVKFLENEGNERIMQIELKAEEDANSIYGNYINTERIKVNRYYEKLEDRLESQRILRVSQLVAEGQQTSYWHAYRCLRKVMQEVEYRLLRMLENTKFYRRLFVGLVIQCLSMLMDRDVGLRVLSSDVDLARSCLQEIRSSYAEISGTLVSFELDKRVFLDPKTLGGVIVFCKGGTIYVENTVRKRLELTSNAILSFIRGELFGVKGRMKKAAYY